MKRFLEYFVLALILLGVPLLCVILGDRTELLDGIKAFPPRTEDWGGKPELLWNYRCPFNIWVFCGFLLFTVVNMFPFFKRAVKAIKIKTDKQRLNYYYPWWGWLGLVIMVTGWVLSWGRFVWFRPYQVMCSYFPIWIGFILVMNALCFKRSGSSPLTSHTLPYLVTFPLSSLFWWFFEYLNRYVWNWYYLGISELSATEYVIYATLCFSSVLPAVTAIAAWLRTFPIFSDSVYQNMKPLNVRNWRGCVCLMVIAMIGLTGIVFYPQWAYPFLWMSPLTTFVLVQILFRQPSLVDRFKMGDWSIYFRFAIASLLCGFCWETWNYYAFAKWVYAVPYVHRFQIWEMPILGFAGYLPFGVECAVVTAWISPKLVGWDPKLVGWDKK